MTKFQHVTGHNVTEHMGSHLNDKSYGVQAECPLECVTRRQHVSAPDQHTSRQSGPGNFCRKGFTTVTAIAFWLALPTVALCADSTDPGNTFKFQLVGGRDTPVCNAYLRLLRQSRFKTIPFCEKPDHDSQGEFERLDRHNLSASEVFALFNHVHAFVHFGDPNWVEKVFHPDADHPERSYWSSDVETETGVEQAMKLDYIHAWTYAAPIDLENNGFPENVLVWQGYGVADKNGGCGQEIPAGRQWDSSYVEQRAFVLTAKGASQTVDKNRTAAVFGSPALRLGGHKSADGHESKPFRPLADSIGIFRYQGRYYIDTEGKPATSKEKSASIRVLLREGGRTEQICIIRYAIYAK